LLATNGYFLLAIDTDDVRTAPLAAGGRLAQQLRVPVAALADYGQRDQNRTITCGWSPPILGGATPDRQIWRRSRPFLLLRAMEHDARPGW